MSTSTFGLELCRNRICAWNLLKMEISSHRARLAGRMPLKRYNGCSDVQCICCTAVLSIPQLSRLVLGSGGSMSGTEDVEIIVTKPFCICLPIALNVI